MDYREITENAKVIELLKQRKEIEDKIKEIDETVLINYELKLLNIPIVRSSYVVFEDGADEGVEGMIQLSVPFKTLEEAQTYASSWRSRKTYVAKMID